MKTITSKHPFQIIENNKEYYIVLGQYAIGKYPSKEHAEKAIKNKDWNLIINAQVAHNKYLNDINSTINKDTIITNDKDTNGNN